MRKAVAVALLALLSSGCASSGEGGPNPSGDGVAQAEDPLALPMPVWTLGDWWAYGVEVGAGEEGAPTTYVITEDRGTDWWMDTDSEERAFQDARMDISRLGAQRKSDLAGSQGDDRVEFFRWPLAVGLSWDTQWDGQQVAVTVDAIEVDRALLTARNATQVVYTYTYDASRGWFRSLDRYGPDGAVAFSLLLQDAGHNWTGTAVRWSLESLVAIQEAPGAVNFGAQASPQVEVPAATTDLWLAYHIPCTDGGGHAVELRPQTPPGSPQYAASGPCQQDVEFAGVAVTDPVPGSWVLAFVFGSPPVESGLAYELLARTRIDVPVGA